MRIIAICLASLIAVSFLVAEDKFDSKHLHGKWHIDQLPAGFKASFEFTSDNKLAIQFQSPNKTEKQEGHYQLEGDTLTLVTIKGKSEETLTLKVLKLNQKEMILKAEGKTEEQTLKRSQ